MKPVLFVFLLLNSVFCNAPEKGPWGRAFHRELFAPLPSLPQSNQDSHLRCNLLFGAMISKYGFLNNWNWLIHTTNKNGHNGKSSTSLSTAFTQKLFNHLEGYRQIDVKKDWCPNFEKLGCTVGKIHLFESGLLPNEQVLSGAIQSECKLTIEPSILREFYNDSLFFKANGFKKDNFRSLLITLLTGYSYEVLKFADNEAKATSRIHLYRKGFSQALGTQSLQFESAIFTDLVESYKNLALASFHPPIVPYLTGITLKEHNISFANCSEAVLFNLFLNLAFVPGELDSYHNAQLFTNEQFNALLARSNPLENFFPAAEYTALFQNKEFVCYSNLMLNGSIIRFSEGLFNGFMSVSHTFYQSLLLPEHYVKGIKGKVLILSTLTNLEVKVFCLPPLNNAYLYELDTVDINFVMLAFHMGLQTSAFADISQAEILFSLIYTSKRNLKYLFVEGIFGQFQEAYSRSCRYEFYWGQVVLSNMHASMIYHDSIAPNFVSNALLGVPEILSMMDVHFTTDPIINFFVQIQNARKQPPEYHRVALQLGVPFSHFYSLMYHTNNNLNRLLYATLKAQPGLWTRKNHEPNLFLRVYQSYTKEIHGLSNFLAFSANDPSCQVIFLIGILNHMFDANENSHLIKIVLGMIDAEMTFKIVTQCIPRFSLVGFNAVLHSLAPIVNKHTQESAEFLWRWLKFCNPLIEPGNLWMCEKLFASFYAHCDQEQFRNLLVETIALMNLDCSKSTNEHAQYPNNAVFVYLVCKLAKEHLGAINLMVQASFDWFEKLPFQFLHLSDLFADLAVAEAEEYKLLHQQQTPTNRKRLLYFIAQIWKSQKVSQIAPYQIDIK